MASPSLAAPEPHVALDVELRHMGSWIIDHLPGIGGLITGIAALFGVILASRKDHRERGRQDAERRHIEQSELDKIRGTIESEGQRLLDIRGKQISDNATRMQELESKIRALTEMYGEATLQLQQTAAENNRLRKELQHERERNSAMEEEIRSLRNRITSLEKTRNETS